MNNYCVYKHTTPNGKVYIGITCQDPKRRWCYGHSYMKQRYFSTAIKKYGWKNIKHEILFTGLSQEEAENKEIELISFYKSNDREFGYNIANGGKSRGMVSEETRKLISEIQKGKKQKPETIQKRIESRKGYRHSPETIEKIKASNKGKVKSEETILKWKMGYKKPVFTEECRKRISEKVKASWTEERRKKFADKHRGEKCIFFGKKFTEEEIKHLQEINRGANSVLSKKVGQFDLEGNLIRVFGSTREAGREGFNRGGVAGVCRGEKHTHKGFVWKYLED